MKNRVIRIIIATGISSVVTQLLTIREFLAQFAGNEFIIALILFSWLILGGIGTIIAGFVKNRFNKISLSVLFWLSIFLASLSPIQIIAIRLLRYFVFVHGADVGFYPTFLFIFLVITPYTVLVGFVLPYSLFVIRNEDTNYSGTRIYITDNIGDVTGGALFSFALVYLVTPLLAIFISNLPLIVFSYSLFDSKERKRLSSVAGTSLAFIVILSATIFEKKSLSYTEGSLVHYQESRYGRISVHQDQEQFTLFQDGTPVFSNQNLSLAEETVHYPLAQISNPQRILIISAEGGIMNEIEKYNPKTVDYVELDPELTSIQFRYGLVKRINGLNIIHTDARAFLQNSTSTYDAIIINLPEPETFQVNRFFTDQFFQYTKRHLADTGIVSFSMEGFSNYLAKPQRQKLSSLYNTVSPYFKNILLIPGQRVFFLCSNNPLTTNIPGSLDQKMINTKYIKGFFYGNVTPQRIDYLNSQMDPTAPVNTDEHPQLIRIMFSQWFSRFSTSPHVFTIVMGLFFILYIFQASKEEYVLFTTGLMTMGCEILVIFAFQIFFGYIYFQIGLIVTIFLAGLLPGAWFGERLQNKSRRLLWIMDLFLIILVALFIISIRHWSSNLHKTFFLAFGFFVSLLCGFQFPLALFLKGKSSTAAAKLFSSDLIGAAYGTLVTSVVLIPFVGIVHTAMILIVLKLTSLISLVIHHGKNQQTTISVL
jgi:spermidine synthase